MSNLQTLTDLGVRTLRITNNEAIAVNPYSIEKNFKKWNDLQCSLVVQAMIPIPAHSIPDGTYQIEELYEVEQFELDGVWYDTQPQTVDWFRASGNIFRTALRLKEPKVKQENPNVTLSPESKITESEIHILREENKRLRFMINNGLGWQDVANDISYPHEL